MYHDGSAKSYVTHTEWNLTVFYLVALWWQCPALHTIAYQPATADSGTTLGDYINSFPLRLILPIHCIRHPASRACLRSSIACGFRTSDVRRKFAYRLRPILQRRIGWKNTSFTLIRSVVSFTPKTAPQNRDFAFHFRMLWTIDLTTAGSTSLPTTNTMVPSLRSMLDIRLTCVCVCLHRRHRDGTLW